ncbi:hypothetical protein AB0M34_27845, partial [Nocardia sp. NPDC050193]
MAWSARVIPAVAARVAPILLATRDAPDGTPPGDPLDRGPCPPAGAPPPPPPRGLVAVGHGDAQSEDTDLDLTPEGTVHQARPLL